MRVAKYPLAVAVSLIVGVMLLGSQLCDFNCSLNGCASQAAAKTAERTDAHAHCHRHQGRPTPQPQQGSQPCAGHFDANALLSASASSTPTPHPLSFAPPLVAAPLASFDASLERLALRPLSNPDRSPPPPAVLRI
ncbi:MAG TPA: hypothetical protein VKA60_19555 [Blastocatellia bacterium]|nr:hypothetical protein [Blastocatellia bacterium]